MRKALCVGVDYYKYCNPLRKCVEDATAVAELLRYHQDESINFDTILLTAEDQTTPIVGYQLKEYVKDLFDGEPEIALFYFSGHGGLDANGGYLCTSDTYQPDDGLSLEFLMNIVRNSKAGTKVIILDSCHSGFAGNQTAVQNATVLPNDTIIFAGCTENSYSYEGVFTPLLLEALKSGASNLVGEVSPGSVYAYIDRALGPWHQRPMFKANIKHFVCLRKNDPLISLRDLRKLTEYFQSPNYNFPLDPTYEEDKHNTENKEVNKDHEAIFAILRKYVALNLVEPVGEKYMYWAALNSKSCRLTAQGKYYWNLVNMNRI